MWEWFLYFLVSHWCTDLEPMAEQALKRHSCWQMWMYERKPEDLSGVGRTCSCRYTRRIFTVWYTLQRVSLYWGTNTCFPVYPSYVPTLLLESLALLCQICRLLFCFPFPEVHRWETNVLPYFFIVLAKHSPALKVPAHESCQYLFQGDKPQHK